MYYLFPRTPFITSPPPTQDLLHLFTMAIPKPIFSICVIFSGKDDIPASPMDERGGF